MMKLMTIAVLSLSLTSLTAQEPKAGVFEKSIRHHHISDHIGDQMFTVGSGKVRFSNLRFGKEITSVPDSIKTAVPVVINENYVMANGDSAKQKVVMFYADVENKRLYINPEYFTNLQKCYADDVVVGPIGGVTQAFLDHGFSGSDVIALLMMAEVVGTYHHLYANVRLVKEQEKEGHYRAHYKATHHYCTNDCYDDDYQFDFEMTKLGSDYSMSIF